MTFETLKTIISNIKAGTFFRVKYETELPVKAEFKNAGVVITKETVTTSRTGVSYDAVRKVFTEDVADANPTPRVNNWSWVLPNRIKYNSNTDKNYLVLAPINDMPTETRYFKNGKEVSKDSIVDLVRGSYWTSHSTDEVPVIITVNADNVVGIN